MLRDEHTAETFEAVGVSFVKHVNFVQHLHVFRIAITYAKEQSRTEDNIIRQLSLAVKIHGN